MNRKNRERKTGNDSGVIAAVLGTGKSGKKEDKTEFLTIKGFCVGRADI